jgi:hypothetical protein
MTTPRNPRTTELCRNCGSAQSAWPAPLSRVGVKSAAERTVTKTLGTRELGKMNVDNEFEDEADQVDDLRARVENWIDLLPVVDE